MQMAQEVVSLLGTKFGERGAIITGIEGNQARPESGGRENAKFFMSMKDGALFRFHIDRVA